MKTTHLLALAAVLTVAGASASAGEWGYCGKDGWAGHKDGWHPWHEYVGDFTKKHGVKFSHGYFYVGKEQKHFTQKWHNPRFKTDFYWDPHTHSPYFWCEGHGVYYPVRHIHAVGPDAKGPGPAVEKAAPGPVGPATPGVGPDGKPGKAEAPGPNGPPPTNDKKAAPDGPPKTGETGVAPPEPTASNPDRLARAQTPAPRTVPAGTFEDPIE